MKTISIYSYKDKTVLHKGHFENIKACLENAINNHINLSYADLKGHNLSNINLDDADMPFADLSNSNLSGANLSEAMLSGCVFKNTALYNTCFSYSDMQGCDFSGASFGATDITGCNISFSMFSTLTCFSLDFTHVSAMKECVFTNSHGTRNVMSRPPVVVRGISKKPIIMTQDRIFHGHSTYSYSQLFTRLNRFLDIKNEHTSNTLRQKEA